VSGGADVREPNAGLTGGGGDDGSAIETDSSYHCKNGAVDPSGAAGSALAYDDGHDDDDDVIDDNEAEDPPPVLAEPSEGWFSPLAHARVPKKKWIGMAPQTSVV
jgi:hypothetical protein